MLSDPDQVAQLTPLVRSIADDGQGHWRWRLSGIEVLGASLSPSFTVAMTFDEPRRIDFVPAPPSDRSERAAVTGWYTLDPAPGGGTRLVTSIEISLDLPAPALARGAVEGSMQRVVDTMGTTFAKNLLAHLAAG